MKARYQKKINTKGKNLSPQMAAIVSKFVSENKGLFVNMAKEWAKRYNIVPEFVDSKPNGLFADLIAVAVYGVCRGALAYQEKEKENRPVSNFEGELRQAARVRVKHLAKMIDKFPSLIEDIEKPRAGEYQ